MMRKTWMTLIVESGELGTEQRREEDFVETGSFLPVIAVWKR